MSGTVIEDYGTWQRVRMPDGRVYERFTEEGFYKAAEQWRKSWAEMDGKTNTAATNGSRQQARTLQG